MDKMSYSTTVLKKGNGVVISVSNEQVTTFAGVVRNEVFFVDGLINNMKELLITAVNNRTRERNYFKKYVEMLEGTISEEDFDKTIEDHEEDYVISEDREPSFEDIQCAIEVAPSLKDVDSVEDLASLFSFKPYSMQKCLTK